MKALKAFTIAAFALIFAIPAQAQDHEVGIMLGATQYQGDLVAEQADISNTKFSFGGIYRYYFNPRLNFKGNLYYGWVGGADDLNQTDESRARRNLSFRSPIAELAIQAEVNVLPFIAGSERYRFAPYVFGGVAGFYMNPKAEFGGTYYALQPLGTEGQHLPNSDIEPYSRVQFAIPYGAGIKWNITNLWNIGLEVGQRKTFTDYIDDVSTDYPDIQELSDPIATELSWRYDELPADLHPLTFSDRFIGRQRGDASDKDMYLFMGITITRTLRKYSCKDF